jgi:hypothetical protein
MSAVHATLLIGVLAIKTVVLTLVDLVWDDDTTARSL